MQTNNQVNIKRVIEPKVYGLLIESMETIFLSIQYAYSLEEAFALAKLEFEKQNPMKVGLMNPLLGSKIGLFCIKSVKELTSEPGLAMKRKMAVNKDVNDLMDAFNKVDSPTKLEPDQSKTPEQKAKNELMKQIIKTKDREMYEKNKPLFTEYECSYIEDQLK